MFLDDYCGWIVFTVSEAIDVGEYARQWPAQPARTMECGCVYTDYIVCRRHECHPVFDPHAPQGGHTYFLQLQYGASVGGKYEQALGLQIGRYLSHLPHREVL